MGLFDTLDSTINDAVAHGDFAVRKPTPLKSDGEQQQQLQPPAIAQAPTDVGSSFDLGLGLGEYQNYLLIGGAVLVVILLMKRR